MSRTRVVLFAFVLSFSVAMGVSAANTATLALNGHVTAVTEISLTNETAQDFDLTVSETNAVVATLNYTSNDPDGFTIAVDSANNFKFVNAGPGSNLELSYTMGIENGTGYDVISEAVAVVNSNAQAFDTAKNLAISYTGSSTLQPGTYADSIIFTIAAK